MKINILLLTIAFVPKAMIAQKASAIQVVSYLNKIPTLENSRKSYNMCTIETNKDGVVSVKDAGSVINGIQDELNSYTMNSVNSGMPASYNNASAPSQEQINQMMQNSTQMKNMSPDQLKQMASSNQLRPSASSANSISLMKKVDTAQKASGKLSQLTNELSIKTTKIVQDYNQKKNAIGEFKNTCRAFKVPGADIALPKCDCIKDVYLEYYQKRVNVEDEYLNSLNDLIQSYIPKLKEEMMIVDRIESECNYGDAISVPALKNQLIGIQRQAMSSIMPILGMVNQRVIDSGKEYANIVNTTNGHAPTPCK